MVYFQLLISISPYTANVTVPFDNANFCVCSFSNTYWNNNSFLFFFSALSSLPKWLGVGGANNTFSMLFSIQNTKRFPCSMIFRFFSFISKIKYPVASTRGEEWTSVLLATIQLGRVYWLLRADTAHNGFPPGFSLPQASNRAVQYIRTYSQSS